MPASPLLGIAAVLVLGVSCQWLAWTIRVPSILLLLVTGIIVGPVLGWLDPDALFGDLLVPIVSISVALILYEGGLTLSFRDLPGVGHVVRNLVTGGMLVTWIIGSLAARLFLGLDLGISLLLGSVVVVTGPTVIGPLLRHIRPSRPVGPLLKWEGIVIDPVGALLAVLVFEGIVAGGFEAAAVEVARGIALTILAGGGLGLVAAGLLVLLLKKYLVPDLLTNPVSVMFVVAAFVGSNLIQGESGFFAVTVMGIALANQRVANVRHIIEFKENLRVLLISSLFILLAARIELQDIRSAGLGSFGFIAALVFVARPLSVLLATWRSPLDWRQRAFLAWLAPRGIVAAAVSSVFALELEHAPSVDPAQAALLVPVTFVTILCTVGIYGLTGPWVARRLGVSDSEPQGVLFVGAHPWGRAIARALHKTGTQVLLVDTNRENTAAARLEGLPVYTGGILAEETLEELDLTGIGRLLALTPNDEVNSLAAQRFFSVFGRGQVYQVHAEGEDGTEGRVSEELRGRSLFGDDVTFEDLERRARRGATVKATSLTPEFDFDAYVSLYGSRAVPLLLQSASGRVTVLTGDDDPTPEAGHTVIALVDGEPEDSARIS